MNIELIAQKIRDGQIRTFHEIFLYATKKDLAEIMKCSIGHIDSIIEGSGKVYLKDVFNLAEALGFETHKERGMVMQLWVE